MKGIVLKLHGDLTLWDSRTPGLRDSGNRESGASVESLFEGFKEALGEEFAWG